MTSVLYVDPDLQFFTCISHIFEKYSSIVLYPVASGEAALAWLSRNTADVIVAGYDLPDGTGIALLGAVKARGVAAPFIIVSDSGDEYRKKEACKGAVFGYVVRRGLEKKPVLNLLRLVLRAAGDREPEDTGTSA
jgi:DNA-binding NtrC family response regulator